MVVAMETGQPEPRAASRSYAYNHTQKNIHMNRKGRSYTYTYVEGEHGHAIVTHFRVQPIYMPARVYTYAVVLNRCYAYE